MTTTVDDRGLVNNLAKEPKSYAASSPTPAEQRSYWLMGIASTLLLAGVVTVAVLVS